MWGRADPRRKMSYYKESSRYFNSKKLVNTLQLSS